VGSPLAQRERGEKRVPLPPARSTFCVFYPRTASVKLRRASHRSSLNLTPLLQHVKQLHGQKHGQEATGGQKPSQTLDNNKKISHWAVIISPPDWGVGVSLLLPLQPGVALGDCSLTSAELRLYLSHGHPACCSSSRHNGTIPFGRGCVSAQLGEAPTQHDSTLEGAIPGLQRHLTSWHPAPLPTALRGEQPPSLPGLRFRRKQSRSWEVKQKGVRFLAHPPPPLATKPFPSTALDSFLMRAMNCH